MDRKRNRSMGFGGLEVVIYHTGSVEEDLPTEAGNREALQQAAKLQIDFRE
jgi:hypothetical protein